MLRTPLGGLSYAEQRYDLRALHRGAHWETDYNLTLADNTTTTDHDQICSRQSGPCGCGTRSPGWPCWWARAHWRPHFWGCGQRRSCVSPPCGRTDGHQGGMRAVRRSRRFLRVGLLSLRGTLPSLAVSNASPCQRSDARRLYSRQMRSLLELSSVSSRLRWTEQVQRAPPHSHVQLVLPPSGDERVLRA